MFNSRTDWENGSVSGYMKLPNPPLPGSHAILGSTENAIATRNDIAKQEIKWAKIIGR